MITGTDVVHQMERETSGGETVDEQYARLDLDNQSIRETLRMGGASQHEAAVIVGGICMGLEFARQRAELQARDEYLLSIAPETA